MRRARYQIGYIVPPFVIAYYAVEWAIERYVPPRDDMDDERTGLGDMGLICGIATSTSTPRLAVPSSLIRSKGSIGVFERILYSYCVHGYTWNSLSDRYSSPICLYLGILPPASLPT